MRGRPGFVDVLLLRGSMVAKHPVRAPDGAPLLPEMQKAGPQMGVF